MKKISHIDFLGKERPQPSTQKRKELQQMRINQEREVGYRELAQLCHLGEYDAAKHLAQRHSHWGYQIVDGEVTEVF
ncbi:MAG: hypothetical protein F6K24_53415 [Okeania sp. SIO2D1]|nr:hypothetical protein [Okeania sp. SIO2D1]